MNDTDKKPIESTETETVESIITPGQLVLKRFLRNKLAIAGIIILVVMTLFAFIGPYVSPYEEYELFYKQDGLELRKAETDLSRGDAELLKLSPPSAKHWLGTDQDGRDVMTRLMYGGQLSLTIGFAIILISTVLGTLVGGLAGYYGKWVDNLLMRIADVFASIPSLPIMIILGSVMLAMKVPQQSRIYVMMFVMGILGWSSTARVVRGQILSLREQEFILATEALGLRSSRRILKHLIPNVVPQLIVILTMGVGSAILMESTLSYLGIGVPFPYASWGNMVNIVNDPYVMRENLNVWIPPGLSILLTVLAFNFMGDGLRDAFDPKMKR